MSAAACPGKISNSIKRWMAGTLKIKSPRSAIPGITLEYANPMAIAGSNRTKPAKGPATPTSNSARRV